MPKSLSDKELVKKVRGLRTKSEFARLLRVSRPLIPAYERGAAKPSSDIWLKMAELGNYPWNVYCWQRAKMSVERIEDLLMALRLKDEAHDLEREQIKRELFDLGIQPEPVAEPLGDEPVGGEPESLKGPSGSVEEFCARNKLLPPVEPIIKGDPLATPAKKAKRARRKK